MIQIYDQFDRYALLRITGVLALIWALVMAYSRMALYPEIPASKFQPGTVTEEKQEAAPATASMSRITKDELFVPEMSASAPALPMNQAAYNWMAEYQPDLIGVPQVGTPLRAVLEHDLKPVDMQDLANVIQSGSDPKYQGRILVYYSHREPSGTVVVAKVDQIDDKREWISICDPEVDKCDGMGITIFASTNMAEST